MEILFKNDYCTIINNFGQWFRKDNILNTMMPIDCYFNKRDKLIRNK